MNAVRGSREPSCLKLRASKCRLRSLVVVLLCFGLVRGSSHRPTVSVGRWLELGHAVWRGPLAGAVIGAHSRDDPTGSAGQPCSAKWRLFVSDYVSNGASQPIATAMA